jgi:pyoverdine/dityrosine biosynthesis protein Dit1
LGLKDGKRYKFTVCKYVKESFQKKVAVINAFINQEPQNINQQRENFQRLIKRLNKDGLYDNLKDEREIYLENERLNNVYIKLSHCLKECPLA